MKSGNRHNGFTLVEVMVAIAILGILAAFALPDMQAFAARMRVRNLAMDLHADLAFARSEAIKRNTTVAVSASGTWNGGWTVAAGGTTLRQHEAALTSVTFTGSSSVTFNANGRAQSQFSLALSSEQIQAADGRCVKLDLSGRPQIAKGACS